MRISERGLELLKRSEGCRLKAYPDAAGFSIGYGHFDADPGEEITQEQADELLSLDLQRIEQGIESQATVILTQGQFDALCCLGYNIGLGALKRSTLMRKLNAGDDAGAAAEFLRWDKVDGAEHSGLRARREQEKELFLA